MVLFFENSMADEVVAHPIKPVYLDLIDKVEPSGIYGADVFIVNSHHKAIIFIGSIHTFALCRLNYIATILHLKYLTAIDVACKAYFNVSQIQTLRKDINLVKDYLSSNEEQKLLPDEGFKHCLNVLDVATNLVLEHEKNDYRAFIIGD